MQVSVLHLLCEGHVAPPGLYCSSTKLVSTPLTGLVEVGGSIFFILPSQQVVGQQLILIPWQAAKAVDCNYYRLAGSCRF